MARPSRPRVIDSSDEDDSFPDLAVLRQKTTARGTSKNEDLNAEESQAKPTPSVRRRKLGLIADNALLRAWTPSAQIEAELEEREKKNPRRPRIQLRSRESKPAQLTPTCTKEEQEGYVSAQEEVTITEDVSLADDVFQSAGSDASEFEDSLDDFIVDDDDDISYHEDASEFRPIPARPPPKPRFRLKEKSLSRAASEDKESKSEDITIRLPSETKPVVRETRPPPEQGTLKKTTGNGKDLADSLSRLKLNEPFLPPELAPSKSSKREQTPPSTPLKDKPFGLKSPTRLSRIPNTPHRPSSDMFWSQEFMDEWNDEHSPRKQLFPDPSKASPAKKAAAVKQKDPSAREAKKAFEQAKHDLAAAFLQELDRVITDGQLSVLAASTGGIKLLWNNKLNTTAGRANWKRSTQRTTTRNPPSTTVTHHHHASIELAEKVIDDEHRLLNVIAHEFCHLANFMISRVTTNPHGREFKVWAAKCTSAFGYRGIEVTTKHTYEIDFKYVWECTDCGMNYKRHSKSINPERQRCGVQACRGLLKQTKPVPRGSTASGTAKGGRDAQKGPTEYQKFMKEEMKRVRQENPGSPQKDIMKIVAGRWSQRQQAAKTGSARSTPTPTPESEGDPVAKQLEIIIIDD